MTQAESQQHISSNRWQGHCWAAAVLDCLWAAHLQQTAGPHRYCQAGSVTAAHQQLQAARLCQGLLLGSIRAGSSRQRPQVQHKQGPTRHRLTEISMEMLLREVNCRSGRGGSTSEPITRGEASWS